VGDPIVCGSKVATGSPDTFIGSAGIASGGAEVGGVPVEQAAPRGNGRVSGNGSSDNGGAPSAGGPGGGGRAKGGGGYNGENQNQDTSTPSNTGLGGLSAIYESGGKGPSAIGYDPNGGWSYGTYQIATKPGTFRSYMTYLQTNNPNYYNELQAAGGNAGAAAGSVRFKARWQELANDPAFAATQHNFIQATHYNVQATKLNNVGLNLSTRSAALRDVVWSTAVQHGPNTNIIIRAIDGRNLASLSDTELINSIYNERGANNGSKYFSSSPTNIRQSAVNRFADERQRALNML
jgi:hypothetical protein